MKQKDFSLQSGKDTVSNISRLRQLQRTSVILILESGFLFLLVVEVGNWLLDRLLSSPPIDIVALFGIFFGLLLAPLLAGLWVAIWQTRENSLSWVVAGALGLILINNLTSGGYDYFYILPVGFVAWLGGKLGRRLKMRFRKPPIS